MKGPSAIWRGRPVSPAEHHRTGRVAEQPLGSAFGRPQGAPTNRRRAGC
jgi:hypothetical protein